MVVNNINYELYLNEKDPLIRKIMESISETAMGLREDLNRQQAQMIAQEVAKLFPKGKS